MSFTGIEGRKSKMRTLTDVPIGVNGKIHYADVMVRGTVSEKSEWILEEFKKLPLYLQEKMLKDLSNIKKLRNIKNADTTNIDNI